MSARDEAPMQVATATRSETLGRGEVAARPKIMVAAPARPRRISPVTVLVFVSALVATAVFSWLTYTVNNRNEAHLLNLATKQAGAVLQAAIPTVQTSMASAAAVAAASDGDPARFRSYMSAYVGDPDQHRPFVSASLWRLSTGAPRIITTVGVPAELAAKPQKLAAFLTSAGSTPTLSVTGVIARPQARLGYAYTPDGPHPAYAIYTESALPPGRHVTVQPGSAFDYLRFALYLGHTPRADKLLETNTDQLPVTGRTSTVTIPFGASALTLVASPTGSLGGALSERLWWLIAITGGLLAIVSAVVAERLVRRRIAAEHLNLEVRGLLREQRTIAETLQRAMLPKKVAVVPGIDIAARYLPGGSGVEIGGDWYDTIDLGSDRLFFVVGDVSGRGVDAASVMASIRFAIRGFASEGYPPARVLEAVARLLDLEHDHHFATVLCGVADIARHEITLANAGHPPILVVSDGMGRFINADPGLPIGVARDATYLPASFTVPPGATLLAYTDGLVERRGENIDLGFERLCEAAVSHVGPLQGLLDSVIDTLAHGRVNDDTAVLAMRWSD